jgi:hypothetical protein
MNNIFKVMFLSLFLVACKTDEAPEKPDVSDLEEFQTVTFCDHKFSNERDFYYQGEYRVYQQTMFDEEIVTFEFTLLDDRFNGGLHYLSNQEYENYICTQVK